MTDQHEQFWNDDHGIFLVPVAIDRDGSLLVPCPMLDDTMLPVAYWAAFCTHPGCGIVSGPVPGTVGVQDIDALSDEEWEALQPWETALGAMHAAEVLVTQVERPHVPVCPHRVTGDVPGERLTLVE